MKKQLKKLTLTKETLRDLTAQNTGEVKGGKPKTKKHCMPGGETGLTICCWTNYVTGCKCP